MNKYLTKITFIFLILITNHLWAQGGREFWFAAPEVTSKHADRPIVLRISSFDKPAEITVSQPANPSFGVIKQTVPANSLISVDLSKQIELVETKPPGKILKTGLLIQSSNDISAYYEVEGISERFSADNAEIFTLKGNNALGKLFYIPMQTLYPNHIEKKYEFNAFASFDIIATENNTTIKISPTKGIVGDSIGNPFAIVLNKGQTYSCQSISVKGNNKPTGSKVESDKPIAITYKDDSIEKGVSYDLIGDQILPVSELGTEYIAVGNSGWLPSVLTDDVFIVGTKNGTTVTFNSDSLIIINEGECKRYQILKKDSCVYINSSNPIYVLHVSGFYNELACANLIPLKCTGTKSYQFLRTNDEDFAINLIVKTGGESEFTLNGDKNIILPNSFREVPGTNGKWKYGRFNLGGIIPVNDSKPNVITNSAHDFNLCVLNGNVETSFRYGYFSSFANLNLGPDKLLCQQENIVLDAGLGKDSYKWNTGDTTQTIIVKDTGTYFATIQKDVCPFQDTVYIGIYPKNTQLILGNDTSACANTPLIIEPKSKFRTYLWPDNSTSDRFIPKKTGKYILEVTDSNTCTRKDSLFFTAFPLPKPQILWDKNEVKFCNDSNFTFTLNESFKSITWFNGAISNTVSASRNNSDEYFVTVKDDNGCAGSAKNQIDCSPYITIPNIFTPNGDLYNETFKIHNLKSNSWQLNVIGRYGSVVYKSDNYNNDWKGENLPDGIYYYHLKNKESQKNYKGTVEILR
ncbi:MAG: gliding motility-associated C-terminal domain-containing protein [Opitutaceae bacterium]|nr:gliding motility-associated C-terminal domain-containing protein [Cytophagales bacterium]